MNLLDALENLGSNKSKKMIYEPHDVFYIKFETNKRIGLCFHDVDVDISQTKRFKGFFTRSIKEKKEFYIQTDGNIAEREIFCLMCEFILKEIKKLKYLDSKDIEDSIKGWVNFGKISQNNLTESIQIGLFGELLFLQLVLKHHNQKAALLAWHGPERKKVDYVLSENLAVEIKAVSDLLNNNVSISSVQQLNSGYENHLLRVYKLMSSPNGKTLNKLFDEVAEMFSGDEKDEFISKCCDYGYNYLLQYDNLKPFSNGGFNDYLVSDDDFPKLIGDFDPRIIEIKYRISLENQKVLESNYVEDLLKMSSEL